MPTMRGSRKVRQPKADVLTTEPRRHPINIADQQ